MDKAVAHWTKNNIPLLPTDSMLTSRAILNMMRRVANLARPRDSSDQVLRSFATPEEAPLTSAKAPIVLSKVSSAKTKDLAWRNRNLPWQLSGISLDAHFNLFAST